MGPSARRIAEDRIVRLEGRTGYDHARGESVRMLVGSSSMSSASPAIVIGLSIAYTQPAHLAATPRNVIGSAAS